MFAFRDHLDLDPAHGRVEVAFTDASLDLRDDSPSFTEDLAAVEAEVGVPFAHVTQVHGVKVVEVTDAPASASGREPADALVTIRRDTGLMIRVADCVPVILADPATGVLGAAHAGRRGTHLGVVPATVQRMRALGAGRRIRAWIGPHVCGSCYEVPEQMRAEVAAAVPATHATTRRGTPSLDLGAGVRAQLEALDVTVDVVGGCTVEDPLLHSHRRDAQQAGRLAGLVWCR